MAYRERSGKKKRLAPLPNDEGRPTFPSAPRPRDLPPPRFPDIPVGGLEMLPELCRVPIEYVQLEQRADLVLQYGIGSAEEGRTQMMKFYEAALTLAAFAKALAVSKME